MFEKDYDLLSKVGVVPVVALDKSCKAVDVAKALLSGGISAMEITYRNADDIEGTSKAILAVKNNVPQMIVGAGTVTNVELAKDAIKNGAKFIISPGVKNDVVDYCIENNIVTYPGVNTASEITSCIDKGLSVLKFFPSEASGGTEMLKSFSGPFPNVKFLPTGGITKENANKYFDCKNVIAVSGSWIANKDLIQKENYKEITRLSKEAFNISLGFDFLHLGINYHNDNDCKEGAKFLELFGFTGREEKLSWFCGSSFELMKDGKQGKNGHIGILTYSIERALSYLQQFGLNPIMESAIWEGAENKSHLKLVYLDKQINGFALHLKRK